MITAFAAFHAAMVFVVNMPDNAIKAAVWPVLAHYDGPELSQGWSIFAPNPPQANVHVLVRGRYADGRMTGWYDATEFFLDEVGKNRLEPIRELGEGLGHAAITASRYSDNIVGHALVTRTAAMVLDLYVHKPLVAQQVELDIWQVPPVGNESKKSVTVNRWSWEKVPSVAQL